MERMEFVQYHHLLHQLWPHNSDRPAPTNLKDPNDPGTIAFRDYLRFRYPPMEHIPLEVAVQATYALARTHNYEPKLGELIRASERIMGEGSAMIDWPTAQTAMSEAVKVYRQDVRDKSVSPPVEWRELEDGSMQRIVPPDWTPRWKAIAGPQVARFIEETGGIGRAAQMWPDTTYAAQFRKWVEAMSNQGDFEDHLVRARRAVSALADKPPEILGDSIAALINQLPYALPDEGRQALEATTGIEGAA